MDPHAPSASTSDSQVDRKLWFGFPSGRKSSLPSKPTSIQIPSRDALYYPMRNPKKRGRCVILNYETFQIFKNGGTREGTEKDVQQLVHTFGTLGFEVLQPYNNLTKQETIDILYFESKWDHSEYDCFVLCILSHGDKNDVIYCTDGFIKTDYIFSLFAANRCSSLVGKPKLFFIQACRGDLLDSGTLVHDSPSKGGKDEAYFLLPNQADFLLFFSTFPGYFSWRNTFIGSWFIQDLCYTLNAYSEMYDLVTMATLVCQKVAFTRESSNAEQPKMDLKKQIPCFMSTLTRLVKFDKMEN